MFQVSSQKYPIAGAAYSLQGGRPENQDDIGFLDTPLGFLLIVCDGMGGGPGGRTASSIAKHVFLQSIYESNPYTPRVDCVKMATNKAEEALVEAMRRDNSLTGMGSTMVAILLNEESAIIAHLGDSRCYQMRGERNIFRTRDHSLVSELVQSKALTEEQARVSPQSNVITRALGSTENHIPDIEERAFVKGDRFILCSDGVWGSMPHKNLIQRFAAHQDATTIAEKLFSEIDRIGHANGGHHDNHTLAIIEVGTNSTLKDKMDKMSKAIVAILAALLLFSLVMNIIFMSRPKKSELKAATEEIEQLKLYQSLYNESNKDKDATSQAAYDYLQEKNKLEEQVQQANQKIASLEAKNKELEKALQQKRESVSNEKKPITKKPSKVVSLQELFTQTITQLQTMRDFKDKNYSKALKTKMVHRDKVLQLLSQIDTNTNNRYIKKTAEIRNDLKNQSIALKIDKADNNGYYQSTSSAKKEIDNIIKQIKQLYKKTQK